MAYKDANKKKEARKEYNSRPESRVKAAAAQKRWREAHPEEAARLDRSKKLKSKYGISINEYEDLLKKQHGTCAICLEALHATKDGRKLAVDHDHRTGKVRGLLCGPCNVLLGCARDSIELLSKASEYLKRHNP